MASDSDQIEIHHLPFQLTRRPQTAPGSRPPGIRQIQATAEKEAITSALAQAGNNKTIAARLLGIHRTHLYKKMKRHGIAP